MGVLRGYGGGAGCWIDYIEHLPPILKFKHRFFHDPRRGLLDTLNWLLSAPVYVPNMNGEADCQFARVSGVSTKL
jgi:hypothetical protein